MLYEVPNFNNYCGEKGHHTLKKIDHMLCFLLSAFEAGSTHTDSNRRWTENGQPATSVQNDVVTQIVAE